MRDRPTERVRRQFLDPPSLQFNSIGSYYASPSHLQRDRPTLFEVAVKTSEHFIIYVTQTLLCFMAINKLILAKKLSLDTVILNIFYNEKYKLNMYQVQKCYSAKKRNAF